MCVHVWESGTGGSVGAGVVGAGVVGSGVVGHGFFASSRRAAMAAFACASRALADATCGQQRASTLRHITRRRGETVLTKPKTTINKP